MVATSRAALLGHVLENGTVHPDQTKLEAARDYPAPTSLHHLRQFLGLRGYFRHTVRHYTLHSKTLEQLLTK